MIQFGDNITHQLDVMCSTRTVMADCGCHTVGQFLINHNDRQQTVLALINPFGSFQHLIAVVSVYQNIVVFLPVVIADAGHCKTIFPDGQFQQFHFGLLLAKGEDGKLKAVSGMEKDGKLNTVDPTKENADKFFQINPSGNLIENFMQKFSGQYRQPSHTGLYAVAGSAVDKIAAFLDKIIKMNPDDKVLVPYKVKTDGQMQEQSPGKYQPLDLNKVDWKDAEKLGLSGDQLQDTLKAMAYGHKSPGLVDIKAEINGQEITVKARLSLQEQPDGSIKIQTHPFQEQPDFESPYMGVKFTPEDIEQFKQT